MRLEVIIFNQTYEPPSTLENFYSGGLSGLGLTWDSVLSVRGLSVFLFFLLCGLLMVSNSMCKDIDQGKVDRGQKPYAEYTDEQS